LCVRWWGCGGGESDRWLFDVKPGGVGSVGGFDPDGDVVLEFRGGESGGILKVYEFRRESGVLESCILRENDMPTQWTSGRGGARGDRQEYGEDA